VKLLGAVGVESTLESPKNAAARVIAFVKNKGCLLRLDDVRLPLALAPGNATA